MTANKAAIRLTLEDGTDLADKLNPRFLEAKLTEKRGGESDELNIVLHNHDGQLKPPKAGVFLSLAWGWETGEDVPVGLVNKGRFKVDEVERSGTPDIVTIRARAADLSGQLRTRKNKMWKDTTLGSILNKIAGDDGKTAKVHPDLAGKAVKAIEQHNKSDMQFVRDLGKRYDAVATWKDKTLIFMPIGGETTAGGKAIPALKLTRRDGSTWSFRHAQRNEHDGAEAQYQDTAEAKRKTVKTGGNKRKRLKKVYATEADAKTAADAQAKRDKRGAFTFDYDLVVADPSIIPNAKATLSGWDSEIDGIKWLVESVETTLNSSGLQQKLAFESAI